MKILLTGAAGFIGMHTSLRLLARGDTVVGVDILLNLAETLRNRTDIGFLFVGRGSDAQRLRSEAIKRGLDNVVFHDEIDPVEIPGLYAQCHVGIVALDPRHKTHNIPGKFLSYTP